MKTPYYNQEERKDIYLNTVAGACLKFTLAWLKFVKEIRKSWQRKLKNNSLKEFDFDKTLSITKKLDYWESVINEHYRESLTKLFGANCNFITPILIPETIYKEYFEKHENKPEFTYWFLQYNAKSYFDAIIKMKRLPEKLKTPLSKNFIKAELKKINDFEQKAENLLHESKFEPYNDYVSSEYIREIEVMRIKAGYYKTHSLRNISGNNDIVELFAEHVYLKEFLEDELNKILLPQTIGVTQKQNLKSWQRKKEVLKRLTN